jgi:predicted GNAT family N-acyltransferase
MTHNIHIKKADWEVDKDQLIDIRTRVFVEEQKVPVALEIDAEDPLCMHFKALTDSENIVATARLLATHYIGRMCVLKEYRDRGIGQKMLSFIIEMAKAQNYPSLQLNAQISAIPFYAKSGFIADSEIFLEADIEHRHMTLSLSK